MKNLDNYLDTNISNFEGDFDIYTGEGDDFLDFAGGKNFTQEKEAGRIFTIKASAATDKYKELNAILLEGYSEGGVYPDQTYLVKEGTADPQAGGINGKGSPSTIESFQNFVKHTPVNLIGIRVQSSDSRQMEQTLTIIEKSPFHNPQKKDFFLPTYLNENTYRSDVVTIPTPGVILGPETKIVFPVTRSGVTITFFVGAVLSSSSALRRKRNRAIKHIQAVGLPEVRRRTVVSPDKTLLG